MQQNNYYFQIPNSIDDADLSLPGFRVYCHIKRVCGENGVCTQGVRKLAQSCGISTKTVVEAIKELKKKGLILNQETPRGSSREIKLENVWAYNEQIYSKEMNLEDSLDPTALQQTMKRASERFLALQSRNGKQLITDHFELDEVMRLWAKENTPNVFDIDGLFETFLFDNRDNISQHWKRDFQEFLKDSQSLYEDTCR